MKNKPHCATFVVMLLTSATSVHAGGLLHRFPDVGEFVVYDIVAVPIEEDAEDQDVTAAEMQGTLRVACVGIEQEQDATSRWIEITPNLAGGDNPDIHMVFKLLVPDEPVNDPDALLPFTRGWIRMTEGEQVMEIAPDRIALFSPGFMFARAVLASAESVEETASEKTLVINGEEVVLPSAVAGEFIPLSQEVDVDATMSQTGEGTWWPHDDYAFVPAADIIWMMHIGSDGTEGDTKGIAIQLEPVETGDDAVSELPDAD